MLNIDHILTELESGLLADHSTARITLDIIEHTHITQSEFLELVAYLGVMDSRPAQTELKRTGVLYPLPYSLSGLVAMIKDELKTEVIA